MKGIQACQIYCGDYHCFVVSTQGNIQSWGYNDNNVLLTNDEQTQNIIVTEPTDVNLPG